MIRRNPTFKEVGAALLNTVTLYLEDDYELKKDLKSKKLFEENMKILTDNGDDGDPEKQYAKLGQALGIALLAHDYYTSIQIIIIGGFAALGKSFTEIFDQKLKEENK